MSAPSGFVLACADCGLIPASDVEMGDVQVHCIVHHGKADPHMELCWAGPGPCPDARWSQCPDPLCYRGGKADGTPHDGDHWRWTP